MEQEAGDARCPIDQLRGCLLAVRNERLVGEEDEPLMWEKFLEFSKDGKAADARIEDTDWIGWARWRGY